MVGLWRNTPTENIETGTKCSVPSSEKSWPRISRKLKSSGLPAFDKWNRTREAWDSAEGGLWVRQEDLKPGLLLRGRFEEPYEFASLSDDGDCQIYFLNGDRSRKDNKIYGRPMTIEDEVVHFSEGITRADRSAGLSWK